ncbi:WhiB family transcriptional regulator [Actinopolymorpha sp. B9G3]|uniref:WhiB family transcriptional regulator n=1 Tax=Actinopolymorpha sp. B9G3 TaxID=3158970 RepID=UPI0032D8FAD2
MEYIDEGRLAEASRLTESVLRERTQRNADCSRDPKRADDWFLPEPPATSPRARASYERTAERLCAACPVRPECLEFALRRESGQRAWGIWGGLAPWQREPLVRARRSAAPEELAAATIRALSEAA